MWGIFGVSFPLIVPSRNSVFFEIEGYVEAGVSILSYKRKN